jgi:hypothetical protein
MPFSTTAKNEMLDGTVVDKLSLHTGDPGGSGTANEVSGSGYARQAATFNAASSAIRALNADVEFAGPANEDATYVGFWEAGSPDVFKGAVALTGDQTFNAAGEYTVKASGPTRLTLTDPA